MRILMALFVSSLPSPTVSDEDDDDDDTTPQSRADADDDGRVYKNPRNSPSAECPRDEEQATLLMVSSVSGGGTFNGGPGARFPSEYFT
ncbi:unnamed protein product [Diatraea saccharalis]|uniref:Secreted protein n=1 Tax=Diatraea saccharalis TaxID=40085 RepID=A0A9N9R9H9_9NEOP|nr:unnamed protein product [Diatraea saccharalis]